MVAALVDALFQDYAHAVSDGAVDRIQAMWSFPAFMMFEGRQVVLDAAAFRENTERLCDFYREQGVVRAEYDVVEILCLTPTTASVRTIVHLYGADDGILTEWAHVHLLSDTEEGLKIAAALPDEEMRAWSALAMNRTRRSQRTDRPSRPGAQTANGAQRLRDMIWVTSGKGELPGSRVG